MEEQRLQTVRTLLRNRVVLLILPDTGTIAKPVTDSEGHWHQTNGLELNPQTLDAGKECCSETERV